MCYPCAAPKLVGFGDVATGDISMLASLRPLVFPLRFQIRRWRLLLAI